MAAEAREDTSRRRPSSRQRPVAMVSRDETEALRDETRVELRFNV